jgi:hypothetical protein
MPGINLIQNKFNRKLTADVSQSTQEEEELGNVVGDVALIWIDLLQVLLEDFADGLHALLDGFVV